MNRITSTVTYGCRMNWHELSEWQRDANQWTVELRYKRRRMTVDFFTGPLIDRDPSTSTVLECLLSDARTVGEGDSFEEWAQAFGYDTDSRSAESVYRQIEEQSDRLARFLGDDYADFLAMDEDEIARHCKDSA